MNLVLVALGLARAGFAVLPCQPRGKEPLISKKAGGRGFHDATTDEAQILKWWEACPDANPAIAVPPGFVVVDVDARNGGQYANVAAALGFDPVQTTWTVQSGAEVPSYHIWLTIPPGAKCETFGPGVDRKMGGASYVMAPGAIHPDTGNLYRSLNQLPIAALPEHLIRWPEAPKESVKLGAEVPQEAFDATRAAVLHYWEDGRKHPLAKALGGWLAQKGWARESVEALIHALPARDPAGRAAAALVCYDAPRTNGRHAIVELLGEAAADWLDVQIFNPRWQAEQEEKKRSTALDLAIAPFVTPTADAPQGEPLAAQSPEPQPGEQANRVDYVVRQLGGEPRIYQRGGSLVEIVRFATGRSGRPMTDGEPRIVGMQPPRLKELIGLRLGPDFAKLAEYVRARQQWEWIRPLDAIVRYPVLRPDGSVLCGTGYDLATQTFAQIDVALPDVGNPGLGEARAALAHLLDPICDFPFISGADRSTWLAAFLTVLARPAIDGPTPLFLFEAPEQGSGKTKLIEVLYEATVSGQLSVLSAPESPEEWPKVLFTRLRQGHPITPIDNVDTMLKSGAFAAILTSQHYTARVLGESREETVPIRTVFFASSNNASLSTDLVRRTLRCRIDVGLERPEARPLESFRYPDLVGHVRAVRPVLLWAGLTILRAYRLAGSPRPVGARSTGSYGAWERVVRDALLWLGLDDPVDTQEALRASADVARGERADLLREWHARIGSEWVTSREAVEIAAKPGPGETPGIVSGVSRLWDALEGVCPKGAINARGLGYALRGMVGRISGQYRLERAQRSGKDDATIFRVIEI